MYILYMEWNTHNIKKASINGLKMRKWEGGKGSKGRQDRGMEWMMQEVEGMGKE